MAARYSAALGLVEPDELGLHRGRHPHRRRALGAGPVFDRFGQRIRPEAVFADVGDVEHRLCGQRGEGSEARRLFGVGFQRSQGAALGEVCVCAGHECFPRPRFGVSRLRSLRGSIARPLCLIQVGEEQFRLDGLDVVERRHPAGEVGDVSGLEAAHDVGDGPCFADAGEEPVAQSFALRRPGHQSRDVHELDCRRHRALGTCDCRDAVEPRVGHRDDADVRLDGAERVVLCRRRRAGQRVVQRRLPDVRQPHYPAPDAHSRGISVLGRPLRRRRGRRR